MISPWQDMAKEAVVSVGYDTAYARGFVLRTRRQSLIITAAHCLPELPPAHPWAFRHEKTYHIVGPLGGKSSIATECLFVDPIADLAVLGEPNVECEELAEVEWDDFLEKTGSLDVSFWRNELPTSAWILSLDGQWSSCLARQSIDGSGLWIKGVNGGVQAGMSGSPILDDRGKVLGLIAVGGGDAESRTEGGPHPSLRQNLPLWLVEQL